MPETVQAASRARLAVIVPSRGRPAAASALIRAFVDTCTANTELVFALDDNDPTREEYSAAVQERCPQGPGELGVSIHMVSDPSTMVHALNQAALAFATTVDPRPAAIGFMGDDHCPRTLGWDQAYLHALSELGVGIVYGNDLLQGEQLPTQCAMSTEIIQVLGYMAPPALTHLYVDNFWRDLGHAAGCLRYLPDVIVEHRHPVAGKAAWDEGYARVNNQAMYDRDAQAYGQYRVSRELADAAKLGALLAAALKVGSADLVRHADGTITVTRADPTITITVEDLAAVERSRFGPDGLLWLDTAGAYRYRPVRFAPHGVLVCGRVSG